MSSPPLRCIRVPGPGLLSIVLLLVAGFCPPAAAQTAIVELSRLGAMSQGVAPLAAALPGGYAAVSEVAMQNPDVQALLFAVQHDVLDTATVDALIQSGIAVEQIRPFLSLAPDLEALQSTPGGAVARMCDETSNLEQLAEILGSAHLVAGPGGQTVFVRAPAFEMPETTLARVAEETTQARARAAAAAREKNFRYSGAEVPVFQIRTLGVWHDVDPVTAYRATGTFDLPQPVRVVIRRLETRVRLGRRAGSGTLHVRETTLPNTTTMLPTMLEFNAWIKASAPRYGG